MSDIKMSDEFKLPVTVCDIYTETNQEEESTDEQDSYATVAINAYDASQEEIAALTRQRDEMSDAIAKMSIGFSDLKQERDELKAMVNGYREIVEDMISTADNQKPYDVVASRASYELLSEFHSKTPTQHLADVRADAVEVASNEMRESVNCETTWFHADFLDKFANKLREGEL